MNLLSNILPGVRDFRAPAIAGILWLAVLAWLFAQPSGEATHEWLLSTSEELTTIEISVALVTSYLIGSIGIDLATSIIRALQRLRLHPLFCPASHAAITRLDQWACRAARDLGDPDPDETAKVIVSEALTLDLTDRMITKPKLERVYQEFTKQKAEAELRLGVCVPLVILTALVALDDVPKPAVVVVLGLLLATSLLVQGILRLQASRSIVAIAVSDGLIRTPKLDALRHSQ